MNKRKALELVHLRRICLQMWEQQRFKLIRGQRLGLVRGQLKTRRPVASAA
ncbi:hypothetical protein [Planococcus maritimus]|uniref:hypothetical protein n=1 Tax=Planococcus maritimus TaxID=192421 RepID=UPI001495B1BC|nr:hypothetical protein [Planococcus maritimus]